MYTSLTVFALCNFLAGIPAGISTRGSPSLLDDYHSALRRGRMEKKPLAVFIASGRKGYEKVCRDGKWTRRIKRVLAKNYVCVYVDTRKKFGQKWAEAFGVDKGIIISDRTTKVQAFRHDGALTARTLERYLVRFADKDLVVRKTETYDPEPVSYSPPPQPVFPQAAPISFGSFGRGGC
jgi:hypothetical protein